MKGGLRETDSNAVEVVNFLTQSPVRVEILTQLHETDRVTEKELENRFDVSRVTLKRNLEALEDRDWIRSHVREFELRPQGRVVAEAIAAMLETIEFVETIHPFLRWFPEDELEFNVYSLKDVTVIVSDTADPYAPVNRHIEALEDADQFRCLLPAIGLPALTVARNCLVEHGQRQEIIYSSEIRSTLQTKPQYRELVTEMLEFDNCTLLVSEREIKYYLGLFEDRIQIGVEDDEGVPQALIETDGHEIREWATSTYNPHLEEAKPLEL